MSFSLLWQNTWEKSALRRKDFFFFFSWFQRFQSMVASFHCYRLVARQNIMVGNMCITEKLVSGLPWSREKEWLRDLGQYTLQRHTPRNPPLPTRPYLLKFLLLPSSSTSWGSNLQHVSFWKHSRSTLCHIYWVRKKKKKVITKSNLAFFGTALISS